jgi:peptidoglycan/xylan/chitin deacetylase (PgdA/CDA1 family)
VRVQIVMALVAMMLGLGVGPSRARELRPQLGADLKGRGLIDGATARRILHFTFDDGPDAKHTPRLLDALDRYGVKATFFFSASRFASAEARNRGAAELAREVARRGHAVGSHSFDHVRMAKLGPPALRDQLAKSDAMFERLFGARSYLFRPPFGSRNRALESMLQERQDTLVMWNIGLADWVRRPVEALEATFWKVLARNELRDRQRGGIVLLHDTHGWSVKAFERIVRSVRARNCALLADNDELYDIVGSLAPFIEPEAVGVAAARQSELRRLGKARCM